MKQVYDFAVKWCDKFRDENVKYIELLDHYLADDCDALEEKKYQESQDEYEVACAMLDE